jgi:hypothetical protein
VWKRNKGVRVAKVNKNTILLLPSEMMVGQGSFRVQQCLNMD